MKENIKFTVHLIREEYAEEKVEYKHSITGNKDTEEFGMGEIKILKPRKELAEYEQIPLIVKNTSVSVFKTDYEKQYEEGIEICEELAEVGEFCSTEKLNQTVLRANFYHSNCPYVISYGYQYTNELGEKVKRQFRTQEQRDKSAFEHTGYEFQKLDWIDRVIPKEETLNSSKQAVKH